MVLHLLKGLSVWGFLSFGSALSGKRYSNSSRQDSFHPAWRNKGAWLCCGNVCPYLDHGLWSLALCLNCRSHLSLHHRSHFLWLAAAGRASWLSGPICVGGFSPSWCSPSCPECIIEVPAGFQADWRVLLEWYRFNSGISQGCLIAFLLPLSRLSLSLSLSPFLSCPLRVDNGRCQVWKLVHVSARAAGMARDRQKKDCLSLILPGAIDSVALRRIGLSALHGSQRELETCQTLLHWCVHHSVPVPKSLHAAQFSLHHKIAPGPTVD